MNLKNGRVAPVISRKAGPQLQIDCNALAPIRNGEVKATDSYNMRPCRKILHCCLQRYCGVGSLQVMMRMMMIMMTKPHQHVSQFACMIHEYLRYQLHVFLPIQEHIITFLTGVEECGAILFTNY